MASAEALFKAAGYDLKETSADLLEDIPLELLHHYQEQGMTETEMAIAYVKFRTAEFKDAMGEPRPSPAITTKDEKDIAIRLEQLEVDLANQQLLCCLAKSWTTKRENY
ncbi:hypothetical protein V6C32_16650 [Desulforamulus ruminis]